MRKDFTDIELEENRKLIKNTVNKIEAELRKQKFFVKKYTTINTNSIYLEIDYNLCGTIRISDHGSKFKYMYKFNIILGIEKSYIKNKKNFYPLKKLDINELINDINKLRNYHMYNRG